ncbi:MAG: class I SAM-dependent methyltransferase [Gudongella sp.]|nr:class I SAM-dependent methyltransferase [Gudongella sp.]
MIEKLNNATQFTEILMERFVSEGKVCVDGTVGNGHDACKLAGLVGESGFVYGFDIQAEAIVSSQTLIESRGLENRVRLIQDTHENMEIHVPDQIDFIIYNLGYLPGGDKTIRTESNAIIKSMEKSLRIMKPGAVMLVTAYRGHQGGLDEYIAVKKYLRSLPQRSYNVFEFSFINQKNNPPITIGLEVRGGRTCQR